MKKVPVEKLNPKDVIAKDVTRKDGTVLVKAGTELTPEIIDRLKKLNISEVYIKVVAGKKEFQEKIKFFKERLDKIDFLFRKYNDDDFMKKMKIFFKNYFKNRILQLVKELKNLREEEAKDQKESEKENGRSNN